MRVLFTAIVFMFLAGGAFCEESKDADKKASKDAQVCPACGLKHIDTEDEQIVTQDPYYGVNEENENPEQWQSYDENTGLPDTSPSDSEWYHG